MWTARKKELHATVWLKMEAGGRKKLGAKKVELKGEEKTERHKHELMWGKRKEMGRINLP
jgi:hypothetical protein